MTAPIGALAAARFLCERSGWTLTNLELQKMLYLAQMVYMGEHEGEPLFTGTFEAWDWGPVLPELYRRVRAFGAGPVMDVFSPLARQIDDTDRREMLETAFDRLSAIKPRLVSITHDPIGAWHKHYQPGLKNIIIPNEAIYQEARDRRAQRRAAARD
jgi:uncharacterized phage-associated protein